MRVSLPAWPSIPPAHGGVALRAFAATDAHLATELGGDSYVPLTTSLAAHPTGQQAADWIQRQRGRHADGTGFSFAIADVSDGRAVGHIGLWLTRLPQGLASVGYAVSPLHRGRGVASDALTAVTAFGWTIPALHRIELYIEPWNTASVRVAEAAGYRREGLLRSRMEIGGTRRDMLLYAAIRPARQVEPTAG